METTTVHISEDKIYLYIVNGKFQIDSIQPVAVVQRFQRR